MENESKINMVLRNTYAVPTLMPQFESGEEASVETEGGAAG